MSEAGEVDTETLLRRVSDIISNTKSLPLTSTYKLDNKEEVLELLDEALERLPDELRQARWMLKERNEFLAKTQREADLKSMEGKVDSSGGRATAKQDAKNTAVSKDTSKQSVKMGSPGMEIGKRKDRYEVLAFQRDGRSSIYASH